MKRFGTSHSSWGCSSLPCVPESRGGVSRRDFSGLTDDPHNTTDVQTTTLNSPPAEGVAWERDKSAANGNFFSLKPYTTPSATRGNMLSSKLPRNISLSRALPGPGPRRGLRQQDGRQSEPLQK